MPETIVVVRAARRRDDLGARTAQRDWANATRTAVVVRSVQPLSTQETYSDAGDEVTATWRVFGLRGVDLDVRAGDRVEWAGWTLEVVGEAARWPGRGGGVHHVEVDVRLPEGTQGAASGARGAAAAGLRAAANEWSP